MNLLKKVLFSSLILFSSLFVKGQFLNKPNYNKDFILNTEHIYNKSHLNPYNINRKNSILSLSMNTASVILNGIGDGLLDKGRLEGDVKNMIIGHSLRSASIGALLMQPVFMDIDKPEEWLTNIGSYVFIRFALFDVSYNITRGLPYHYVGSTSLHDKTLRAINAPSSSYTYVKGLSLLVGISLSFDLNGIEGL